MEIVYDDDYELCPLSSTPSNNTNESTYDSKKQ